MKITKRQLRRIIREQLIREMKFSREEVEQYIRDQAYSYRSDPTMTGSAMRDLLMDDFMDNIGAQYDIRSFQDLIDEVSIDTPAPGGLAQEVPTLTPPKKYQQKSGDRWRP
tara:strand:- start:336 stop:668 length:333 start_codon:yes stop_codon:yes gene_type:complete